CLTKGGRLRRHFVTSFGDIWGHLGTSFIFWPGTARAGCAFPRQTVGALIACPIKRVSLPLTHRYNSLAHSGCDRPSTNQKSDSTTGHHPWVNPDPKDILESCRATASLLSLAHRRGPLSAAALE